MEIVLNEVSKLSDAELRQHLIERGESVGPILHSLRKLFHKKLAKHILRERGINPDDASESPCYSATYSGPGDKRPGNAELDIPEEKSVASAAAGTRDHAFDGRLQIKIIPPSDRIDGNESLQDVIDAVYYGISLPTVGNRSSSEDELVFRDKIRALKVMKEFKGSRFKVFKNKDDALRFSRVPAEEICPSPKRPPPGDHEPVLQPKSGPTDEKCSFKEPTRGERINLMKLIEKGETEEVKRIIWSNPRIIISNGDTPVILHESFRYNALHIVAKFNQAEICQLYIDAVEDPTFLKLMFPTDTPETTTSRINWLLDLYLNMPEKGVFDGVLHTASKYGSLATVKILAAHPQTDLNLRNKYNETAADVVCRRANIASQELKDEILEILSSNVYVPLLRTEDNTEPPFVGKPWSPDARMKGNAESASVFDAWEHINSQRGEDSPLARTHSPLSRTPKDPKLKVKAYAGPMSPTQADKFYKKWRSCPVQSPDHVKRRYHELKRGDMEKGLERLGRDLAQNLHVPWTEYWDFLGKFLDLPSHSGLKLLEDCLREKAQKQCQNTNFENINNNNEKIETKSDESKGEEADVRCFCSMSDSFDESMEERLNGGGLVCIKCGRRKESENGADESDSDLDLSQISDSPNSSLGSLVEQMGNLKVKDSFESLGESRSKAPVFCLNPFIGTEAAEENDSESDEEFFETSQVSDSKINAPSKYFDKSVTAFGSSAIKKDKMNDSLNPSDTEKSSHWSVIGVLRNAFAGLQIFSPRSKGAKSEAQCLETPKGLGNDVVSSDNSPDDEIFLDAEDSFVGDLHSVDDVHAAPGFQELCSTPKCVYSGAQRVLERETGSLLFPGRLQRIFIEGNQPTKLDLDVLRAVDTVDVNPSLFPYTAKWKETVTNFSTNEQSRWPSPAAVKRKSRLLTPQSQSRSYFQTTPKATRSADEVVSKLLF